MKESLRKSPFLLAAILLAANHSQAGEPESVLSGSVLEGAQVEDPRGLSTLTPNRRRTPTGFLYPFPLKPAPYTSSERVNEEGEEILLRGYAELGWIWSGGQESEARYREFSDPSDGPWLRRFSLEGRERDGLTQFSLAGGSVGRPDGFYRAQIGQVGRFRLRGEYDGFDHTYSNDAHVLYSGVGGEQLRLPASLTAGSSSAAEVEAALASISESRIAQSRNESKIDLSVRLRPDLLWLAGYRLERRDGERPFGGTLGTTFGQTSAGSVIETLEPIHSRTHEWSSALEYASPRLQTNLRYRISLYDNRRESLTWENPFPAVDLGFLVVPGEPSGRSALSPDNHSQQLSADVATQLPLDGRFVASAAWSQMRQDERLLPATINPDLTAFSDLSRTRADALVSTLMLRSKIRIRPIRPLVLNLGFRFFQRDNDTNYRARDDTTGRYGYITEDLAPTDRVGAVPFSYRKWSIDMATRWALSRRSSASFEFEHEAVERSHRARSETREERARLSLSTQALEDMSLRFAYEYRGKSGSSYDASRDDRFYAASPTAPNPRTGPSRSLLEFRQFDLARHHSHEFELRSNFLLGPSTDLAWTTRYLTRDYGSDYGVRNEQLAEIGLDATYLPSPKVDLHSFTSFEWRDRRMTTINSTPGPAAELGAGGATFPISNRWSWDSEVLTIAAGAGVRVRPIEKLEIELEYRFQYAREDLDMGFDPAGGALTGSNDPMTASRNVTAERTIDHVLGASATYELTDVIATTVFYKFEDSTILDYQQRGLVPLVNQNLYLGSLDNDYTVHVIGLTTRLSF